MEKEYTDGKGYDGKEFREALKALDVREYRKVMKKSFRTEGRKVRKIVERYAKSSGLRHGANVGRTVRVRVYPKPYGFMITTKPHGKQGYYKRSQDGKEKPVAMWADSGTVKRTLRHGRIFGFGGKSTGRMKALNFTGKATKEAYDLVTADMLSVIEETANKKIEEINRS